MFMMKIKILCLDILNAFQFAIQFVYMQALVKTTTFIGHQRTKFVAVSKLINSCITSNTMQ